MSEYRVYDQGETAPIIWVNLRDSSGVPVTGLDYSSATLLISVLRGGESSPTVYDVLNGTTPPITTIGTYAAPSSGKARFAEIDTLGSPGWYEIQLAAALFAGTNDCRALMVSVECPNSGCGAALYIQLRPQKVDVVRFDGDANADATLRLAAVVVEGEDDTDAVVQITNTGDGAGLAIVGGTGNDVLLPCVLAAPDVGEFASWGPIEGMSFMVRYAANKMVISKGDASMTLYDDDGTTPLGSQTISDDGSTQTRGPLS